MRDSQSTATRPAQPSIRLFEPADRAAVVAVCTATVQQFTPLAGDPGLAPLLFAESYLDLEPERCFVATAASGEVIGYALGTIDTAAFRRREMTYFRRRLGRLVAHHAVATLRGRYRSLASHRRRLAWFVSVVSGTYAARAAPRDIDLARYPAHCHLQVAPAHRATNAGVALLRKFQSTLRSLGVPGQHVSVVEPSDEGKYSRLAMALGFRLVHERPYDASATRRDADARHHVWRLLVREYDGARPAGGGSTTRP